MNQRTLEGSIITNIFEMFIRSLFSKAASGLGHKAAAGETLRHFAKTEAFEFAPPRFVEVSETGKGRRLPLDRQAPAASEPH